MSPLSSRTRATLLHLVGAAILTGCGSDRSVAIDQSAAIRVDSLLVASSGVTPDPQRTYEYRLPSVGPDSTAQRPLPAARPDSILPALVRAGLAVTTAWRPEAYICLDIVGPRLTVELAAPDDRMTQHDFVLGTGRLLCSNRLWQYVLITP